MTTPSPGFEPGTKRLTVVRSTAELRRIGWTGGIHYTSNSGTSLMLSKPLFFLTPWYRILNLWSPSRLAATTACLTHPYTVRSHEVLFRHVLWG